jgi:hypothetical protein
MINPYWREKSICHKPEITPRNAEWKTRNKERGRESYKQNGSKAANSRANKQDSESSRLDRILISNDIFGTRQIRKHLDCIGGS